MSMVLYLKSVKPKEPEVYRSEITDIHAFMFESRDEKDLVDFDVEFMALHYVVSKTGDLEELTQLILYGKGAAPVSEDGGYGPAYYVGPTRIAKFASALGKFTNEEIRQHFDSKDMVDAYVGYYFTGDDEKDWNGLSTRIDDLRTFVDHCKANQFAIIGLVS